MGYPIDRIQKVNENFTLFNFTKIKDVKEIYEEVHSLERHETILEKVMSKLDNKIEIEKLNLFRNLEWDIFKVFIIYDEYNIIHIDNLKEDAYRTFIYSIKDYSKYFRNYNNKSLEKSNSKVLGSAKIENMDKFTNEILNDIYGIEWKYDGGLDITKKLLVHDPTSGIDIDFYIENDEILLFEFLKRENEYITNSTAHPMRYCWTGGRHDNKKKFISLWSIKEKLGAKLFLVNYSDDEDEDLSIIEVLELDNNKGIRSEVKTNMKYEKFIEWLLDIIKKDSSYFIENGNVNYLKNFNVKEYDSDFFDNWKENKSNYGK